MPPRYPKQYKKEVKKLWEEELAEPEKGDKPDY